MLTQQLNSSSSSIIDVLTLPTINQNSKVIYRLPDGSLHSWNGTEWANSININNINQIPARSFFDLQNTPIIDKLLFTERLNSTKSFPNIINISNNVIYGVSTNGTAFGGVFAYSLNGKCLWQLELTYPNQFFVNDISGFTVLNDKIFTAGDFGSKPFIVSIDGTILSYFDLSALRIRFFANDGTKLICLIHNTDNNTWFCRFYDDNYSQIGSDIPLSYTPTTAGVYDGKYYIGSNNRLDEFDFNLNLIRTYNHTFGATTMIPTFKNQIYPNRILIGSGSRLLQFDTTNGNLLGNYNIHNTRGRIIYNQGRNDDNIFMMDTGYLVGCLGNTGIIGGFGHNSFDKLYNAWSVVLHDNFYYVATSIGIYKIVLKNNL